MFPNAIEADHLAEAVTEAVPVGLGEIVELVHVEIDGSGREFVQMRFPEVGTATFDESDLGAALAA